MRRLLCTPQIFRLYYAVNVDVGMPLVAEIDGVTIIARPGGSY
jgi:hypothetical protein